MKNIFKLFVACAFATLGFSACQQEEINYNEETATHTVTFIAESPETKTTVDISDGKTAKFAWTAEDVDRFTVYENGTKATKAPGTLSDGTMTVKATFDGPAVEGASYVAVVNSSNDGQIMSAAAYDEAADILVSKAVSSFDGDNGVQLQFKREVAIAKMTLKGLDAGEVVNMITVSSTADIAGSYGVDGWASTKTSLDIYSKLAKDGQDGYSIVANASGEAVVWFTCIPQDAATLTVKVDAADGDTYTKEFSKPITLTRGDVKAFGVAMAKGLKKEKVYSLVESAPVDWTGKYILVATNSDINYALDMNNATSDWGVCSAVSIENNSLSANSAGIVVIVEKGTTEGTYSIKSSDGNYLSASAKGKFNYSSTYKSSDNDFEFTINESTHIVTVAQASSTNSPKRNLRYNYNNGNGGFRWYDGTTGSSPKFYSYRGQKYILPSPEGISVNSETKMVSWNAVDGAASYVLTIGADEYPCLSNFYEASAIEDEYYDVSVVAVPSDTENYKNSAAATLTDAKFGTPKLPTPTISEGVLEETSVAFSWTKDARATNGYHWALYNGETLIKEADETSATSAEVTGLVFGTIYTAKVYALAVDGEKPYVQSATATLDLSTKAKTTISTIVAAGIGTTKYAIADLTVMAVSGSNFVVKDNTGLMFCYKSGATVGDVVTLAGTYEEYQGLKEFKATTYTKASTASVDHGTATELNSSNVAAYVDNPVVQYVKVNATVAADGSVKVGDVAVYQYGNSLASYAGNTINLYGYTLGYNTTKNNIVLIQTSVEIDQTVPSLSVSPTAKTWVSDETVPAVFTVTTNTEGEKDWTVSPTTLDWATIAIDKTAGTITVTPKDANKTDAAREATLTVSHAAGTLSETINLTQKGVGVAAPASITIDSSTKNFPSSYGSANTFSECTLNGLKYKIQQVYVNGDKLQWRASGHKNGTGTMYNSEEMPAGIASIVIKFNASDSSKNHTVQIGNSANPTSATSITPTKNNNTYTYTCDGSSKYFVITNGEGAGYIDSIVINFE